MIDIDIPGFGPVQLKYAVLDYNGTLAVDGLLAESVAGALLQLSQSLKIHIITADTFGKVLGQVQGLPLHVEILHEGNEAAQKKALVEKLGSEYVAAVGNGNNDREMLSAAKVGIAVLFGEGAAVNAVNHADIIVSSAVEAIGLLLHPQRLKATLRT